MPLTLTSLVPEGAPVIITGPMTLAGFGYNRVVTVWEGEDVDIDLAPLRSDPAAPADVAFLGRLGGDGDIWVSVGRARQGRALLVDNYNINQLDRKRRAAPEFWRCGVSHPSGRSGASCLRG
jgi:hypothetical protein